MYAMLPSELKCQLLALDPRNLPALGKPEDELKALCEF
jgi:hypothetical protein